MNSNAGTTLNTSHLLPTSGYEPAFNRGPWDEGVMSGNCYSYAIGDFRMGMSEKPQPGDISRRYADLHRNYNLGKSPLWRDCVDIEKRVIADGISAWRLLEFPGSGSVIRPARLEAPADPGHYKIVTLTDDTTGPPSEGTDYHFMRQDSCNLAQIYNLPMYGYLRGKEFTVGPNPYERLKVNAFTSGNRLERMGTGIVSGNPAFREVFPDRDGPDGVPRDLVRSVVNVGIHVDRIPEHVIRSGNFIPDPFWIMGVNPFNPGSDALVDRRLPSLERIFEGRGMGLHALTVLQAARDCKTIRANPRAMPKKNVFIGLWSHKLGWGSHPINTDGDAKLILDPRHANKRHGDLNYSNVCKAFQVMREEGIASDVF